ncbi:hypothetical protein SLA2020_440110 [Shorea laevis]
MAEVSSATQTLGRTATVDPQSTIQAQTETEDEAQFLNPNQRTNTPAVIHLPYRGRRTPEYAKSDPT